MQYPCQRPPEAGRWVDTADVVPKTRRSQSYNRMQAKRCKVPFLHLHPPDDKLNCCSEPLMFGMITKGLPICYQIFKVQARKIQNLILRLFYRHF